MDILILQKLREFSLFGFLILPSCHIAIDGIVIDRYEKEIYKRQLNINKQNL